MEIIELYDIDETASTIFVLFLFDLEWRDPKLTFNFLKNNTDQNLLSPWAFDSIWYPDIRYLISEKIQDVVTRPLVSVRKQGKPTLTDESYPNEVKTATWLVYYKVN